MVGAIASSQIAEYVGRKGSLMIAAIPNIIGWLAISFAKGPSSHCSLLAVLSGKSRDNKLKQKHDDAAAGSENETIYPFSELSSSGCLEVKVLTKPSADELSRVLEQLQPDFVYLQGKQLEDSGEIGSFVWEDFDLSTPKALCGLFSSKLPNIVYLETPKGEKLAEALHFKGVPYTIYWENDFPKYAASHFHQAFFSVAQSTSSHTWDAFQLALASFRLYCVRNNVLPSNNQKWHGRALLVLLMQHELGNRIWWKLSS